VGGQGQGYYGRGFNRYGGYGPFAGYGGSRYAGYGSPRNRQTNMNILQSGKNSALKISQNLVPSISKAQTMTGLATPSTTKRTTTTRRTSTSTTTTPATTTTTSATTHRTIQTTKASVDPYLSINPKFAILPAVPGVDTPSQLKTPPQERLPKKIPPGKDASLLIPARFMPLPAVPTQDTVVAEKVTEVENAVEEEVNNSVIEIKLEKEIVKPEFEDISEKPDNVSQVKPLISDPDPSAERRAYKRCHGKCVQKFCLPVGSLTEFDKCTAKCKGICTQKK